MMEVEACVLFTGSRSDIPHASLGIDNDITIMIASSFATNIESHIFSAASRPQTSPTVVLLFVISAPYEPCKGTFDSDNRISATAYLLRPPPQGSSID
jgi:hypothetical protein